VWMYVRLAKGEKRESERVFCQACRDLHRVP
jgi:hypothetical protein